MQNVAWLESSLDSGALEHGRVSQALLSGGSNYCIKILLSDSDDPGQFSGPGIKRIKELDQGPLLTLKTRQKVHTKNTIKLTHKRNASALAQDSQHLRNT